MEKHQDIDSPKKKEKFFGDSLIYSFAAAGVVVVLTVEGKTEKLFY